MGILMERHSLQKEATFEVLRQHARAQGRKVAELAQEVVDATELLNGLSDKRPAPKGLQTGKGKEK
jgi:response regulator NasT